MNLFVQTEYLILPIHVGSHVRLHDIVSKPELNKRMGFVVSRNGDRWGVVLLELDCEPGTRKIWSLKPDNLTALASFKALKVTPEGDSNVTIEPFDFGRSLGDVILS